MRPSARSGRSWHASKTVYAQGVKGPFGCRVAADYELTAYEPDTPIAFRAIVGPVRPEGSYDLEPAGDGTRLTFSLSCTPPASRG